MDSLNQTAEFMRAAGQEIPAKPTAPHLNVAALRLNLLLEELTELADALGLRYVFNGMMLERSQAFIGVGLDCGEEVPYIEHGGENTHEFKQVEVLDALTDLRVVLDGAVLACGMQDVFPAALAEVHRSNMSKFCIDGMEVEETQFRYRRDHGIETEAHITDRWEKGEPRRWVIKRKSDGKVLKSCLYSPANLAPLLS